MLHARGVEVTEDLNGMYVGQCLADFQFDDETALNSYPMLLTPIAVAS
jgi:hypothetical protein